MELDNLWEQTGEWLKAEGRDVDIVLSSRIRLARNIQGFPFVGRANVEEKKKILEYALQNIKKIKNLKDYIYLELHNLDPNDVYVLFERHLISKEHAGMEGPRGVFFKRDETVSMMMNEEDHLRIQMMHSGFHLAELWEKMDAFDDVLAAYLPYSFHEDYGYLTACPTNLGTGLRVSVMLHLPGLNITQQMDKVHQGLLKHHLMLRGYYGEGTVALGDFFQLSNQKTLGKTEKEIVTTLEHVVPQIIQYERQVRAHMLHQNYSDLLKLLRRAKEGLCRQKSLSTEQTMKHLSAIRLGVHLQLLPINIHKINHLFLFSQPAHLQKKEGRILTTEERDAARALFCKNTIENN